MLPKERLVVERVECDTIRASVISDVHRVRDVRMLVLQLEEIQLRLLRNYLINMGSQERVCLDYLRAYGALDRGLDFGLRTGRDSSFAGQSGSVRKSSL